MLKKGLFITLEGTDGVGKTTQIKLLKSWFKKKKCQVLLTREPGGGPFAEKIRRLLLDPRVDMTPRSELLLYEVSRIEHVEKVIRPALKKKKIVISDRFYDATTAYQGYARKLPLGDIHYLNQYATSGLKPDLTILLDLPPHVGLKKATARKAHQPKGDRLEKEGLGFQKLVRKGYLALAKKEPRRIKKILVKETAAQTQEEIRNVLSKRFHL